MTNAVPRPRLTAEEREVRRERDRLRAKKRREEHPDKVKEYQRHWIEKHPGRMRELNTAWRAKPESARSMRNTYLKRVYGITVAQEQEMLKTQNSCCAICETTAPGKRGWHVDHNHSTNAVRGILCQACNKALAFAKDSPILLRKMAIYLEQHGHA